MRITTGLRLILNMDMITCTTRLIQGFMNPIGAINGSPKTTHTKEVMISIMMTKITTIRGKTTITQHTSTLAGKRRLVGNQDNIRHVAQMENNLAPIATKSVKKASLALGLSVIRIAITLEQFCHHLSPLFLRLYLFLMA